MPDIIDKLALAGDNDLLNGVATQHPFGAYVRPIRSVEILRSENGPRIDFNDDGRVVLWLTGSEKDSPIYQYILYHELGHVYDRMDPTFFHTMEARQALNGDRNKYIFVTDLWNTYIDGRLDKLGLFKFLHPKKPIYCSKHPQKIITVDSVESYIEVIAYRYFDLEDDLAYFIELLKRIWNSSQGELTYPFFFEQYEAFQRSK